MKFVEEGFTVDDVNKALDRLYRRIVALEQETNTVLRRTAPTNPIAGDMWYDVEGGKIQIFNGTTWDTWTKD